MCQTCETKPVYEFTNKRKLCRRCFINWFQKKFLYTIRKFRMVKRGEVIAYQKSDFFKEVVLEDLLKMFEEKGVVELFKTPGGKKKFGKIALPDTIDSTAYLIVDRLIKHNVKDLKNACPVEKDIIKPLYLFTDEEVLLYAKLKGLKFAKIDKKKSKISLFVDKLEKKHPEVKRAIVKGFL